MNVYELADKASVRCCFLSRCSLSHLFDKMEKGYGIASKFLEQCPTIRTRKRTCPSRFIRISLCGVSPMAELKSSPSPTRAL